MHARLLLRRAARIGWLSVCADCRMIVGYNDKRTEMFAAGEFVQALKASSDRLPDGWRS